MTATIGHNTAADLKERVRRIAGLAKVERQLKARTKEVSGQIRDAYKKAGEAGHEVAILKKVIREALLPFKERVEVYDNEERVDQLVEATRDALGLRDGDDVLDEIGIAAEADAQASAHADLLAGNDVVDDVPVMDHGTTKKGGRR